MLQPYLRLSRTSFARVAASPQDYETALHPKGRVLTLSLTSTWGDLHYIGLNGLELLDPSGTRIGSLARSHVAATPFSVASLPSMQGDPRTPDKLVDGVNATLDDRQSAHEHAHEHAPAHSHAPAPAHTHAHARTRSRVH
eukprot:2911175-Pleurochrysis_carterae.AAC.1